MYLHEDSRMPFLLQGVEEAKLEICSTPAKIDYTQPRRTKTMKRLVLVVPTFRLLNHS